MLSSSSAGSKAKPKVAELQLIEPMSTNHSSDLLKVKLIKTNPSLIFTMFTPLYSLIFLTYRLINAAVRSQLLF